MAKDVHRAWLSPVWVVIIAMPAAVSLIFSSANPPKLKWWQSTIVYQIYPRSYKDTDGNGLGDLKGIISELDYIKSLNVKAIWISPFYPSPMRDMGYDTTNQTDIDPVFGSLQDFDVLLAEAHKRGIRLMIDFIPSYTSIDHSWFKKSVQRLKPYDNYFVWADGRKLDNGTLVPPSNWVSVFGYSAWEWSAERGQYFYHTFLKSQPQLNYRSAEVREEMKKVLHFWFNRGIDGMRVDALDCLMVSSNYTQDQPRSYLPNTEPWMIDYYLRTLTANIPEIGPVVKEWREILNSYDNSTADQDNSKFMIVEVYSPPELRNNYYVYGADMPFNFDLVSNLNASCNSKCIHDLVKQEYDTLPKGKWANFVFSNHDNNRASSKKGAKYADALNTLLLTLVGTPTTYYGEEIGMLDISVTYNDTQDPWGINYGPDHYQEVSRDPERSPMQWNNSTNAGFTSSNKPWLPVHPKYQTVNVDTEKNSKNTSSLKVYQDLSHLRNEPSLQYGALDFCDITPQVLCYIRTAKDQTKYLILINFDNSTAQHDFSGPPIHRSQGRIKVVTSTAANQGRFLKDGAVDLTDIILEPGDGLVIQI